MLFQIGLLNTLWRLASFNNTLRAYGRLDNMSAEVEGKSAFPLIFPLIPGKHLFQVIILILVKIPL